MPMMKNAPFFKVVEEGEVQTEEGDEDLYNVEIRVEDDAGGFKAIRTYKCNLALTSPVFKQHFYGGLSSNKKHCGDSTQDQMEVVNIKGFAFNIVKDFIELIISSNVSIVDTAEDFAYLFEMLRIADMYEVLDLVELVKGRIATVKITPAEAVKAASIAEKYKDLLNFEEVSEGVVGRCAVVLHDNCPNSMELTKSMSSSKDNQEVVGSLINKELWNNFQLSIVFSRSRKIHLLYALLLR